MADRPGGKIEALHDRSPKFKNRVDCVVVASEAKQSMVPERKYGLLVALLLTMASSERQ
jgi:hypothetical protein